MRAPRAAERLAAAPRRGLAAGLRAPVLMVPWLIAATLLAACAAPGPSAARSGPVIEVDGLVFENRSRAPVDSIRLLVPATGEFVQCGNIPPGGRCATGFPERVYSGNAVEVDAVQRGTAWTTGMVDAAVSPELAAGGRAEVRVIVIAPGSAGVQLLPHARRPPP